MSHKHIKKYYPCKNNLNKGILSLFLPFTAFQIQGMDNKNNYPEVGSLASQEEKKLLNNIYDKEFRKYVDEIVSHPVIGGKINKSFYSLLLTQICIHLSTYITKEDLKLEIKLELIGRIFKQISESMTDTICTLYIQEFQSFSFECVKIAIAAEDRANKLDNNDNTIFLINFIKYIIFTNKDILFRLIHLKFDKIVLKPKCVSLLNNMENILQICVHNKTIVIQLFYAIDLMFEECPTELLLYQAQLDEFFVRCMAIKELQEAVLEECRTEVEKFDKKRKEGKKNNQLLCNFKYIEFLTKYYNLNKRLKLLIKETNNIIAIQEKQINEQQFLIKNLTLQLKTLTSDKIVALLKTEIENRIEEKHNIINFYEKKIENIIAEKALLIASLQSQLEAVNLLETSNKIVALLKTEIEDYIEEKHNIINSYEKKIENIIAEKELLIAQLEAVNEIVALLKTEIEDHIEEKHNIINSYEEKIKNIIAEKELLIAQLEAVNIKTEKIQD